MIFNFTEEMMAAASSTYTATEIHQQPSTWKKTRFTTCFDPPKKEQHCCSFFPSWNCLFPKTGIEFFP